MPGSTYNPLDIESPDGEKSEVERFREAAHSSPPKEELVSLVGLDTGLRAGAIGHMIDGWLDRSGDVLTIDVPQYERCEIGNGESGKGGDTTKTGAPCHYCRNRNTEKDWLPSQHKLPDHGDCWRPKSEAGFKGRELPIKEPDTARIVENYFAVHDTVGTANTVKSCVVRVAERAGLLETWEDENGDTQRWPTTHDLRNTFGTRLALKDFNAHEIKSVMGHSRIEQAIDYIELSGAATRNAFDEKW